ncbi:hypothetical protein ACI65C_013517 [Semiaphis heraclei]
MSDFEDSNLRDRTPEKTKRSRNEGSKSKKPTHKKQKFRTEWMDEKDFKIWLVPVVGEPFKGKCKLCSLELTAELTVLKKHQSSQKHLLNLRSTKNIKQTINSYFIDDSKSKLQDQIKKAEMLLCGFISEHNLSFNTIGHLSKLCQEAFTDSSIAKELNKLETKFWELVQLFTDPASAKAGATADKLYSTMLNSFIENKITLDNIIGFASDGCNTMFGAHNSVSSKLKEQFPGIFLQKCICHSLHLVASAACKTLPRDCEDLVRDIFNYFKSSCKRISQLKEFQDLCELEPHKMLRPAQTRWLSLSMAVSRIIEQWEALKQYFAANYKDDRLKVAENIYHRLKDPSLFMYYTFLNYILPKITSLNKLFQSDKTVIDSVFTKMSELYKDILFSFVRKIPNPFTYNPNDESQYLPLKSIYLGASMFLLTQNKNIDEQMLLDVLKRCRLFLIEICIEIKLRFDFSDKILSSLIYISPKNIFSQEHSNTLLNFVILFPRICNDEIQMQVIDDEWRKLNSYFDLDIINILKNKNVDMFWLDLYLYEENGEKLFSNLSAFVLNILSLPQSNCVCERLFSKVNLIKTKLRNKLMTNTINGLINTSECVKITTCVKFQPTKTMYASMNNEMYDFSKDELNSEIFIDEIVFE